MEKNLAESLKDLMIAIENAKDNCEEVLGELRKLREENNKEMAVIEKTFGSFIEKLTHDR